MAERVGMSHMTIARVWRAFGLGLRQAWMVRTAFLVACLLECSTTALRAKEHIIMCVYRYQIVHNESRALANGRPKIDFLETVVDENGSSFMVDAHDLSHQNVRAVSPLQAHHLRRGDPKGVSSEGYFVLHRISRVAFTGDASAEVDGEYRESGSSAAGYRYLLQCKDGTWTVVERVMLWISQSSRRDIGNRCGICLHFATLPLCARRYCDHSMYFATVSMALRFSAFFYSM